MDIVPLARPPRHPHRKRTTTVVTAVAACLMAVPLAAYAGSGASISVPDGVFAGTTTATVSGSESKTSPTPSSNWIRNQCYQDGSRVLSQYVRPDADGRGTLTLGPTELWQSGGATCVADYGSFGSNGRWRTLSSTKFTVSA